MATHPLTILAINLAADTQTALNAVIQNALPNATLLTAPDTAQAMALTIGKKPDVILLDIEMRGEEGYDLCRQLKSNKESAPIPVICLTAGQTNRERRRQALDAGADGFLAHPLDEVEVIAQIRAMAKLKAANLQTPPIQPPPLMDSAHPMDGHKQFKRAMDEFFEQPLNLHLIADFNGRIYRVNQGWERLLGYPKDELEGRSFMDLVHPDDRAATLKEMEALSQGNYTTFHFQNRYRHKQGDYRLLVWSAIPSLEENLLYAVGNDITERVEAEEKLRQSEEQYRTILHTAMDGYWLVDIQGQLLDVNERYCQMSGYSVEELLTLSIADLEVHETSDDVASHIYQIMTTGEDRFESQHRRKDGTLFDVEVSAQYRSQIGHVVAFLRDITERKQAEEKLADERRRLAGILEGTNVGTWEWNVQSGETIFNERWAEIIGYTLDELAPISINTWASLVHPDDLAESNALLTRHFAGELLYYDFECRMRHKDGHWIWVHDRGRVTSWTDDGKPLMMFGTHMEITERKRAEILIHMRLDLMEFATTHSVAEVLQKSLDLVGEMTASPIGFYHFVESDQKNLSLQAWSTRTLQEFCQTEGEGLHYPLDQAGVWTDAAHTGKPVVHNDYASLPHRKGLPEGHAHVIRELVVPIQRRDKIVAILGVGNKAVNYTERDIELVAYFADIAWAIAEQKQAEAALRESEANLRKAQHVANMGSWIWHIKSNRLQWSDQMYRIFGIDSESFTGDLADVIARAIHPDDRAAVDRSNLAVINEGRPSPLQYRIVHPDGTLRIVWAEAGEMIRDEAGHPALLSGIVQDITEEVQAAQERERLLAQVQAQAQQIGLIMDTVPEGVLLIDVNGQVLLANATGERDLAALADAQVGDRITTLGTLPLAHLLDISTNGQWQEIRASMRTFEAIARPIANGQSKMGNPAAAHWVVVINDVTQERNIRAQLQQQERLAAVGQLAAGIAHDFNNILAVIALHAPMLLRSPNLTVRDRERLTVIRDQTAHATRLIQQILDFSRRATLELRPLDLGPFLKEQIKLLARALPEAIHVSLNCEPGEYMVMADPTRIQQVIMNLAVNARDAMPHGGALILTLAHQQGSPKSGAPPTSWVRLEVTDSGTGIPDEVRAHIFEPFFTTKPVGQGTGLGLAQVHGIVKQHEGEITVSSVVGQGSTFTLYLPTIVERVNMATSEDEIENGGGETILIVEDNQALLLALSDIVEMLGYNVLGVNNGVEALTRLESAQPGIALVLSDLSMPVMGGEALLEAMQNRGIDIPMVILSGYPLDGVIDSLKRKGLAGWLMKPPQIDQLAQILTQALTEKRQRE